MNKWIALGALALIFSAAVAVSGAPVAEQAEEELVLTPFGRFPASCVHGVKSGAHVHAHLPGHLLLEEADGSSRKVARCGRPRLAQWSPRLTQAGKQESADGPEDADGWQVYVKEEIANVTALTGYFSVPAKPQQAAQTIFAFTGLQNIDWVPPNPDPSKSFDIIQPVLQFGSSSAGGGYAWYYASWYVTLTSDVVYSELVTVDVGHTVFGNMTKTGDNSWFIDAVDVGAGGAAAPAADAKHSSITITRSLLEAQPWSYGAVLEEYDIDSCYQVTPKHAPINFTKLTLQQAGGHPVTPTWAVGKAGQSPPACLASITVHDPATITIVPSNMDL